MTPSILSLLRVSLFRNSGVPILFAISMALLPPSGTAQETRRFFKGEWSLSGEVPPRIDSPLLMPILLAANDSLLFVYDYGDQSVKGLSWNGELKWSFGRRGQGPNEFSNPTHLVLGPKGDLWITDPSNRRVTVLSTGGTSSEQIRIQPGLLRVVPLISGGFWGVFASESGFLQRFGQDGEPVSDPVTPEYLKDLHPISREAIAATATGSFSGLIAFHYSDRFFPLLRVDEVSQVMELRGIEALDFPDVLRWERSGSRVTRIDPGAVEGTLSASVVGTRAYILFGGSSDNRGRLLDVYDLSDGSYIGSYLLPSEALQVYSISDQTVAVLVAEPLPAIRVWTWVSES